MYGATVLPASLQIKGEADSVIFHDVKVGNGFGMRNWALVVFVRSGGVGVGNGIGSKFHGR